MAGASSGILNQEANPLIIQDGTSNANVTPGPGITCRAGTLARAHQGIDDVGAAWTAAVSKYLKDAAIERCGEDFRDVLNALIPGLVVAFKIYVGTVGVVTIVGAILGSLAGGAGAVPGAVAGAKLGNVLAMAVLEIMGLGFLAVYVAAHIHEARIALSNGIALAWGACGSSAAIDLAARQIADGLARLLSLALQALVAYAAKEGTAAAVSKLKRSGTGAALGEWLQRNTAKAARPLVSLAECLRRSGMEDGHFRAFQKVAAEMNRIIAVRNTNLNSLQWIRKGFPPKPIDIKIKTSPTTGIVTAVSEADILTARNKGFYVVDADGVARNGAKAELKVASVSGWTPSPGEVVHPIQAKPLVGDYDLLGVIDPTAKGRNLVLAASDGEILKDWSNPQIAEAAKRVNSQLDQPRVMHGTQDGFGALPDKGGSTVFMPDGRVFPLTNPQETAAFYDEIGRQTITGSYTGDPKAGPPVPPVKGPPKLTVLPGGKQ